MSVIALAAACGAVTAMLSDRFGGKRTLGLVVLVVLLVLSLRLLGRHLLRWTILTIAMTPLLAYVTLDVHGLGTDFSLPLYKFLALGLIGVWIVATVRQRGGPGALVARPFVTASLLFILWSMVSISQSESVLRSAEIFVWLPFHMALAFVVIYVVGQDWTRLAAVLRWILLSSVPYCLFGVVQFLAYQAGAVLPGSDITGFGIGGAYIRVNSTLGDPNLFAGYIVLILAYLLVAGTTLFPRIPTVVRWAYVCPLVLDLLLTSSRGGWAAAGACVALAVIYNAIRTRDARGFLTIAPLSLLAVAMAVVLAQLGQFGPFFASRFSSAATMLAGSPGEGTQLSRTYVWDTGLTLAAQNPLFGVGPGGIYNWASVGVPTTFFLKPDQYVSHNIFVDVVLWSGVPGLLLFTIVLFIALYRVMMPRIGTQGNEHQALISATGIGLVALLVHGMSLSTLVQPYLWIALALAEASRRMLANSSRTVTTTASLSGLSSSRGGAAGGAVGQLAPHRGTVGRGSASM